MNYSNLSAHLYSLHVVNSPACICSHTAEDTAHYFLDLPLYYAQRMILRNVVRRYTQFDLKVLLYGDSGNDYDRNAVIVQAVHDYIRDSKRFKLCTLHYVLLTDGLIITIKSQLCITNSWF